jgi:hypothetical protein
MTDEVHNAVTDGSTAGAMGFWRLPGGFIAPEDEMLVLFVEVDNHTEPAEVVARKQVRYRASSAGSSRTTAAVTSRCGRRCGTTPAEAAVRRWLSSSRRTSVRRRRSAA